MRAVAAFLTAAVFSLFVLGTHAKGGLLAPCGADSDCDANRECRGLSFDFDVGNFSGFGIDNLKESISGGCSDSDDYCVCFEDPESLRPCRNDDPCLDSEECDSELNLCISKEQAQAAREAQEKGVEAICPIPTRCPEDRQCVSLVSIEGIISLGVCLARFTPSSSSSSSGEGDSNEGAADNGDEGADGEDDSSEICIAAKSLAHIEPNALLFRNHIPARVLCDSFESCATPGHMVRYRGDVMMMKSYCKLVGGCTRTVMHVNSPRYRRALEVPSDTPHLSFTAFAARYTSKLEERVLRTAVRMGL